MSSIFDKAKLTQRQLRTVADRRFADAEALRKTNRNRHANGAMYLGGFVIECLLKAKLLEKYTWLRTVRAPDGRPRREQRLWSLVYRLHSLDEILGWLPEITQRLVAAGQGRLVQNLKNICSRWTVFARYSPKTGEMSEARKFLDQIRELKTCLK